MRPPMLEIALVILAHNIHVDIAGFIVHRRGDAGQKHRA